VPKNTPNLPPMEGGDEARKSNAQTKSDRRAAAQRLMREQQAKAKRRTVLIQSAVGLVVVVVVVAIVLVVLNRKDDTTNTGATPPGLTSDGGVLFGSADAKVKVSAIEDFQCPICDQFEKTSGDKLKEYRDGTDVSVEYRPIAFLDRSSSTEYSSRALNASMCVLAAKGKDAWLTMHQELYDNQPAENTAGLPDSDLVDMANQAGATGDDVKTCIDDRRYDGWVKSITSSTMGHNGVNGTPTVYVNGEVVSNPTPDGLDAAVSAASGS
jgi:protein-disulfide isomerase